MTEQLTETLDDLARELDREHVFHSWSAQSTPFDFVVASGRGVHVWDHAGREYLDFSSQLVNVNIGHQHPAVVQAIREQAELLTTIAPSTVNLARGEAARRITGLAPDGFHKVFFTNGGADANEHAVRMARLHTGRHKVLTTYRSYHGGTHLAVNLTGDPRRWASDHGSSGTVHFFGPFLYRSAFHATTEEDECQRALEHLEQVVALEGPSTIAAIVLEAIPGTAGIMVPPPGYLAGVREICDRQGIVMIADEVMSGFGRSGRWFAVEHATDNGTSVVPDLITFAKGVNSGYVPMGGVAISDRIHATFAHRAYPGGLTYSGHPLACAAAVATIRTMEDEDLVGRAARLGEDVLGPGLRALADKHAWIGEVRGTGAFWAIELVSDRETRAPLAPYGGSSPEVAAVVKGCQERGMLPFSNVNRIHVVPPLTTTDDEAREGLAVLDAALTAAAG